MSLETAFARVEALAADLPGVSVGTSYGTPALKAAGKMFVRMKDSDTLVLMVPLEEKELLLEAAPEIYFETAHYRGWPAVLVRLAAIPESELAGRLAQAFERTVQSRRRGRSRA